MQLSFKKNSKIPISQCYTTRLCLNGAAGSYIYQTILHYLSRSSRQSHYQGPNKLNRQIAFYYYSVHHHGSSQISAPFPCSLPSSSVTDPCFGFMSFCHSSKSNTSASSPLVSGIKKNVEMAPRILHAKNIHSTFAKPITLGPLRKLNSSAERMAPILPTAALNPWPRPRTREGNTSAGTMKVVALGPKLKKNCKTKLSTAVQCDRRSKDIPAQ